MRKILYLIAIITILGSCSTPKLADKTQKIDTVDSLVVLPPFVLYGEISDFKVISRLQDSGFNAKLKLYEYNRQTRLEFKSKKYWIQHVCSFLKKCRYKSLDLLINDSLNIKQEIDKMESKIQDSSIRIFKISSTLKNQLLKYKYNLYLCMDVTEYYDVHHAFRRRNFFSNRTCAWLKIRIFIIDIRKEEVVYYNYLAKNIGSGIELEDPIIPRAFWRKALKSYFYK